MGIKISVCGKGGSGKSTLVSLLAHAAQDQGFKTLVVDSDGGKESINEKMRQPFLLSESEITLEQIPYPYVNEKNGLRLLSIGKIHQAMEGCACPMGVLNREFLKKLRLGKNEIAIVDMEAGVEHFGRGIDNSLDAVLVVVEPSFESIALAEKIKDLASGINKDFWAVLNKISSENLIADIKAKLKKRGMDTIGVISYDASVFLSGLKGSAISQGRSTRQASEILESLLLTNEK